MPPGIETSFGSSVGTKKQTLAMKNLQTNLNLCFCVAREKSELDVATLTPDSDSAQKRFSMIF